MMHGPNHRINALFKPVAQIFLFCTFTLAAVLPRITSILRGLRIEEQDFDWGIIPRVTSVDQAKH